MLDRKKPKVHLTYPYTPLDWPSSDVDPEFSKSLQSLITHADKACGERGRNGYGCEEILASAILSLQQLSGTNYKMLPSVTAALSLLLSNASIYAGFLHDNETVQSLWRKIRCLMKLILPGDSNIYCCPTCFSFFFLVI